MVKNNKFLAKETYYVKSTVKPIKLDENLYLLELKSPIGTFRLYIFPKLNKVHLKEYFVYGKIEKTKMYYNFIFETDHIIVFKIPKKVLEGILE